MNTFVNAIENTPTLTTTENGAITLDSSKNALVDLFFYVGAARGKSYEQLEPMFMKAWVQDKNLTIKIMLWARDVRHGAGERQTFRHFIKFVENQNDSTSAICIQQMIPEIGRFDDLFAFEKGFGISAIFYDGWLRDAETKVLAAKWFPLKDKKITNRYRKIISEMQGKKVSPKELRKFIVSLRNGHIVETKMCEKRWDEIDFSKLPSLAMVRYNTAFCRNVKENYETYKKALVKGETTVNSGAVYPYDLTKTFMSNNRGHCEVQIAQWNQLENYLGDDKILPVVDVSQSMNSPVGDNPKLKCMDIAVSLGLYIADKQSGAFKDLFCTFHGQPKIEKLNGDIYQKCIQLKNANWGYSTNIEAVFKELLDIAIKNNVSTDDMPKTIAIISDMEFNAATKNNKTNFEMFKEIFEDAGYELPKIIFWNVQARNLKNVPVKFDENNVALISGFNAHILKSVLKGAIINPYQIMHDTVNIERYDYTKMLTSYENIQDIFNDEE